MWWLIIAALAAPVVLEVRADGVSLGERSLLPDEAHGCRVHGPDLGGADAVIVDADADAPAHHLDCALRVAEGAGFNEIQLRYADGATLPLATRCRPDQHPARAALDDFGGLVLPDPLPLDGDGRALRVDVTSPAAAAQVAAELARRPALIHLSVPASGSAGYVAYALLWLSQGGPPPVRPAWAPVALKVDRAVERDTGLTLRSTAGWVTLPWEAMQAERWCVEDVCTWELLAPHGVRYAIGPAGPVDSAPWGLPTSAWATEVPRPAGTVDAPGRPRLTPGGFTTPSRATTCWEGLRPSSERMAAARAAAHGRDGLFAGCVARAGGGVTGAFSALLLVGRGGDPLDVTIRRRTGDRMFDACATAAIRRLQLPAADGPPTALPLQWSNEPTASPPTRR